MARLLIPLCFLGLLLANRVGGQALPKHPTATQVVNHQMQQQKSWNLQQLPKNSVLYKFNQQYEPWRSIEFSFSPKKQQALNLSSIGIPTYGLSDIPGQPPLSAFERQLLLEKKQFRFMNRESWWKDLMEANGSLWLRDLLIQSRSKSTLRP